MREATHSAGQHALKMLNSLGLKINDIQILIFFKTTLIFQKAVFNNGYLRVGFCFVNF